jgi:hypothetical protein
MKRIVLGAVALALIAPSWGWADASFKRPECAPGNDVTPEAAEARCIREARKRLQDANFADLQQAGLMFSYMARPDLERFPEAKAVLEKKTEGAFSVVFSVAADGTVSNAAARNVTDGMQPIASMWVDTIREWTFAKVDKPVTDIEHRRIYLYPKDDAETERESRDEP